MPARFQPERTGLLLEIGELSAGHFMQIDFRGRPLEVTLEGRILVADGLPIEGNSPDRIGIKPGIALTALQRLDYGAKAGLRCIAG